MARKKKLRGFENVAQHISSTMNVSMERARAILAAQTRAASPAAKQSNPALRRVKGNTRTSGNPVPRRPNPNRMPMTMDEARARAMRHIIELQSMSPRPPWYPKPKRKRRGR